MEPINKLITAYQTKIVGQEELSRAMIVSLLANGHILLESLPGLAKTLAVKTLAEATNGTFSRIQCTPDLLPSDIIGTQIYNYNQNSFETKIGPVYANFVLLDEINRSSAKTQSAMLEAMQERQVSIGGIMYQMPDPFIVMATENPIEQEGTYELPEAQLDRFLMKIIVHYPSMQEESRILDYILSGQTVTALPNEMKVSLEEIKALQQSAKQIRVDDSVKNYIVNIVAASRTPQSVIDPALAKYVEYGISPRGAISLMRVAQVLAMIHGRDYVVPDDVKEMRYAVLRHRIMLNFEAVADDVHPEAIIDAIFSRIRTP